MENVVKEGKKKNLIIGVLVGIIILLLLVGAYFLFIKEDIKPIDDCIENNQVANNQQAIIKENQCNCPKCKECEKNSNVDNGIIVYQNGKIVDLLTIKKIKGKYQINDYEGKETKNYIILSDKLSECEIFNQEYLEGLKKIIKGKDIIAIKIYLFANWRHLEKDNTVDSFVLEYSVKEDDGIRNYMYTGWDVNGEYLVTTLR